MVQSQGRSWTKTSYPTAVVAGNDHRAVGLLDTLIRSDVHVPRDSSVVGYDDSRPARMAHINLTTVHQNLDEMATALVADTIERTDEGRTDHKEVVQKRTLVVRGATLPRVSTLNVDGTAEIYRATLIDRLSLQRDAVRLAGPVSKPSTVRFLPLG